MSQYGICRSIPLTLPAVSANGDSDIVALPRPEPAFGNTLSWTVKPTASAQTSTLYGSLDGTNWVQIDTTNITAGVYGKTFPTMPWLFMKATLSGLTGTNVVYTFHVA
jgi:hypothetical protein